MKSKRLRSPVIEGSVPHMLDLVLGQLEDPSDVPCHIHDCTLLLGTNVVHLPSDALVQDAVEGRGHILYKQVAASSNACMHMGIGLRAVLIAWASLWNSPEALPMAMHVLSAVTLQPHQKASAAEKACWSGLAATAYMKKFGPMLPDLCTSSSGAA